MGEAGVGASDQLSASPPLHEPLAPTVGEPASDGLEEHLGGKLGSPMKPATGDALAGNGD